jgi:antitoxin (DNA-binding transcriptional repressor) of toxin-antitoxin stability system
MKRISIQALKSGLSAAVAEAEAGQTLVVTRHSRAVARLAPLTPRRLHGGRRDDAAPLPALTPLLRRATRGRYLHVLLDDRSAGA